MYPSTIFNWHDNSGIQATTSVNNNESAPLLMQVFSSDKGSEDLVVIKNSDEFSAMYGTMSFAKHGQAAIQAQNIVNNGGRLLAKRVVATDSTLANVVLIANVTGTSSTEGGAVDGVKVKWTSKSITGCKTFEEVKKKAAEEYIADQAYPLFVFTDNGRGVSSKAVRLNPDYNTSNNVHQMFYTLAVYEGTLVSEQKTITVNPNVIYSNVAYGLDKYSNVQVSGEVLANVFDAYVGKLSTILGIDADALKTYDVLYGYDNKGVKITNFVIDAEGVDLDSDNGIALANGSNGNFGDAPINGEKNIVISTNPDVKVSALSKAIMDIFLDEDGANDEIYDLDTYKVAAICDANYDDPVKNVIFDFVEFRKDCIFVRDYGTGLKTFAEINARHTDFIDKVNYFTTDFATSYMITDPLSKKNIEVTATYDIAALLVSHIENNPYAPLAGFANGFILKSAIKGTLNFVPTITPKANQKASMDDIRVNYAIFEDDNCVVQSQYTANPENTQLSYTNNVIAIQRVLRAVRSTCPKQRFSISTSTDLQSYANAVNNVLSNYTTNFATLNFIYTQDELKTAQKIFYASIEFAFLGWAQTEIFDIYAINN